MREGIFMTGEGFNHTQHETSDQSADGTEAKSKSKKKIESGKDAIADRGKDLWGKLLGERKEEEALTETDKNEADKSATHEYDEDENDPALEALTADEEAVVTRMYAEARLDELEAGRSEDENPADAAAREADITLLRDLLAENEVAELEHEAAEQGTPPAEPEPWAPEVRPFEPDEAIDLSTPSNLTPKSSAIPSAPSRQPAAGFGQDMTPTPGVTPTLGVERAPSHQRDPRMGYLLLGGAVGYLIGRRRGRIKTEKRLATVRKKLERQVEAVQEKVMRQEASVQKLARQNYELTQDPKPRQEVPAPAGRREFQPPAAARQESSHFVTARPEVAAKAESLNREQLLEASGHVRFGETNLRRVYDAQLVDETGLRRLMHEAEAGHDLRRALAREFLVKELRFERDPRLKGGTPDSGGATGGGTAFVDSQSGQPNTQSASVQSSTGPAAMAPPPQPASPRKSQQTNVSSATLITLTIFTLALALYAIWLTVTR
jgi:hypothetical protein